MFKEEATYQDVNKIKEPKQNETITFMNTPIKREPIQLVDKKQSHQISINDQES